MVMMHSVNMNDFESLGGGSNALIGIKGGHAIFIPFHLKIFFSNNDFLQRMLKDGTLGQKWPQVLL